MAIPAAPTLGELADRLRAPARAKELAALVAAAKTAAALPIVRRAYRYADVGQHRTWLDGRAKPLSMPNQEAFALAMSDHGAGQLLASELPLLAAACRLVPDAELLARVLAQLSECATWSPLQRPGWTRYAVGAPPLPPDGDGAWLATGTTVRALADALELLPPASVPAELRAALERLLAAEIAQVCDDWATKRPWFVQARNVITNQWVLPTEGLLRACLVLGREKHAAAYELAVKNFFLALDAHGPQGEFAEGIGYAQFTVTSFLHGARAMAVAGDGRALAHPFLARFPGWYIQHFQPGRQVINAFDASFVSPGPRDDVRYRSFLSLMAVMTGSGEARWALDALFIGPSDDLYGWLAGPLPPAKTAPPTWASYERATRVNWRSSWADDASGCWVRGGHATDQHDHQDRGHVSFTVAGRPLLIEAGTPAYHHPDMVRLFACTVGHNLPQIGTHMPAPGASHREIREAPGFQRVQMGGSKVQNIAPLTEIRLEATGGEVTVNGDAVYDAASRWRRTLRWDARHLECRDELTVKGEPIQMLWRWHLATSEPVALTELPNGAWRATWPGAVFEAQADTPLQARLEDLPDHTLEVRVWDDPRPSPTHKCLILVSPAKVATIQLHCTLHATPA